VKQKEVQPLENDEMKHMSNPCLTLLGQRVNENDWNEIKK